MLNGKLEITSPNPEVKEAVEAIFIKVLEDKPKGESVSKIHNKIDKLQLPGGPAWINGKWW